FKSDKRQNSENDSLTPTLVIDDKVLKEIIKDLYYPSPYIFKEIPVEILGQVYEQFLGKVIRLTAGHRAKVEEKPEVRKAGGVYYTPKYIVDYIVENTVGELVKGKTPKDAAELKIVDPACGSGSFLLGAFQYLLNWHEKWYLEHSPEEWAQGDGSPLAPTVDGSWRLSTDEKKRILLNNIYGVDIDPQAVEVTKLSLLLKVLEGETGQMSLGFERVLPDLGENIQCGNSLISNEFYLGRQLTLFDEDERYRINAFDWINAFPEVFNREGFDAVIGNPPYIRIQAMKEWAPTESEYYKEKYVSASKGNFDIYVVFIEKGLNILNSNGLMGFILPNKFFNSQYGEKIRNLISGENFLSRIVDFTDQQVFDNATTYTCLLFLDKRGRNEFNYSRVYDIENWKVTKSSLSGKLKSIDAKRNAWNFFVGEESKVLGKLENFPIRLSEITDNISQGIRTSANKIYVVLAEREISENVVLTFSKELQSEVTLEKELLHQFLKGQEIRRYNITYSNSLVIIPYSESNGNFQLISESELESNYPLTYNYLLENKRLLENREHGRMRGEDWYGYVYPKNFELMSKKKILTPDIADRCNFAYDETGDFSFTSGYCITLKSDKESDYFYILGILNSKLIDFFFKRISTPLQNGYFRFFSQYLNKIPVCLIDFSNENQSNTYNRIVELVKNLRYLNREIRKILSPNETDRLKRQIDATDAEIDRLVYELYGLTDEEIRIVEESVP
ncbi:MAG: TaqI-like C-terminal specificity domain-containing protein, partial [Thermotogota bacterium]|nr:TaqI-like C-terminal specificity domain-containing protein [Thermotogota bacterium]